jgi:hypothetical protein
MFVPGNFYILTYSFHYQRHILYSSSPIPTLIPVKMSFLVLDTYNPYKSQTSTSTHRLYTINLSITYTFCLPQHLYVLCIPTLISSLLIPLFPPLLIRPLVLVITYMCCYPNTYTTPLTSILIHPLLLPLDTPLTYKYLLISIYL